MTSRDSIFFSSVRAFCVSFFAIIGIAIAFVVVMLVLASMMFTGDKDTQVVGHYTVLPDADGKVASLKHDTPLILHLDIVGVIGAEDLNASLIRDQLERSQQKGLEGRIHAVLLRVNSPGGVAFEADAIYRAIQQYRKRYQVPVYAWVDGLCASGGIYSAVAANKIYASDVSLVGSIGVISTFFNVSDTFDKIGVKAKTISRGKGKAALYPFTPWKEGDDADIQLITEYLYNLFVEIVTTNRPHVDENELVNEYGASVFPAPRAQEIGYIDGVLTDESDALRRLAAEAGISDDYQVIRLETRSWVQQLFRNQTLIPTQMTHKLSLPGMSPGDELEGHLYLYQP